MIRRLLPLFTLAAAAPALAQTAAEAAPPTWAHDIAPLVYKNCTSCHHPGGAGPFSLLTYQDARRWSAQVLTVTQSRYMPPWLPAPGYGDFADNRRLSDNDLAEVKRWVTSGMPEGLAAEAPPAPSYTGDWELGPPDLVLTASRPFQVPADGPDVFRNFIYPVPLRDTRYIRAIEILPGNSRVVHHANILIDRSAELRRQHPADWQAGIPGMELEISSGDRFDPDSHFLFWKPDTPAIVEPAGMAWRLDPGNDLILNTHLKPTGRVETVQPRIGLYFTATPPDRQPMLLQLEHDDALDIPPGDAHFVVEDQLTLPIAVHALGIYPHAHYLGKQLEAWSIAPDGTRTRLILIHDWDIDRQSVYSYKKPPLLPAGSVLHMRYVYDNSENNPRNPANPPVRVRGGNQSTDEMGHLWLQVLPVHPLTRDRRGDEIDSRLLLERAWMEHRLARNPRDTIAAYNLASVDAMSGDSAAAAAIDRRLAAADPRDARIPTSLGVAEQQAGHWQAALDDYRRALAIDASDADARYDLAALELDHGLYPEAAADFRAQLAVHPDDAASHAGLAAALAQMQQPDAARQEFERSLALDPAQPYALANYAALELAEGDAEHARDLLTRAVAAGAHDPATYQRLAFADMQTHHVEDGIAALRDAISANPGDPVSHGLLAQTLAARGDLTDAIAEQQAALRIDPKDADGWCNLGVLHAQSGHTAEARQDFEHALALDPQHAQARANLDRLSAAASK